MAIVMRAFICSSDGCLSRNFFNPSKDYFKEISLVYVENMTFIFALC